jgi:hypothetical protein
VKSILLAGAEVNCPRIETEEIIMSEQYCRDCKWQETKDFGGGVAINTNFCFHPSLGINLVTGGPNTVSCHTLRKEMGACGLEGTNFEPKESA